VAKNAPNPIFFDLPPFFAICSDGGTVRTAGIGAKGRPARRGWTIAVVPATAPNVGLAGIGATGSLTGLSGGGATMFLGAGAPGRRGWLPGGFGGTRVLFDVIECLPPCRRLLYHGNTS
jgi:hypothetical protein